MSVIIVGADYLGQIKDNLESSGITDILHISGRNVNDRRKMDIPKTASGRIKPEKFVRLHMIMVWNSSQKIN